MIISSGRGQASEVELKPDRRSIWILGTCHIQYIELNHHSKNNNVSNSGMSYIMSSKFEFQSPIKYVSCFM